MLCVFNQHRILNDHDPQILPKYKLQNLFPQYISHIPHFRNSAIHLKPIPPPTSKRSLHSPNVRIFQEILARFDH